MTNQTEEYYPNPLDVSSLITRPEYQEVLQEDIETISNLLETEGAVDLEENLPVFEPLGPKTYLNLSELEPDQKAEFDSWTVTALEAMGLEEYLHVCDDLLERPTINKADNQTVGL